MRISYVSYLAALASLVAPAFSAHAQAERPPLSVTEFEWLGVPPVGGTLFASTLSINESGHVGVTMRDNGDQRLRHSAVHTGTAWERVQMTSILSALNNAGEIAGAKQVTSPEFFTRAVARSFGIVATNNHPISTQSVDINADGVVVGTQENVGFGPRDQRPFVWDRDGLRFLAGLASESSSVAINDAGAILTQHYSDGAYRFQVTQTDGSVRTLALSGTGVNVQDMNIHEHLTGWKLELEGFFWDGSSAIALPLLPGDNGVTLGIGLNDFDQVVGYSRDCVSPPAGCDRATLWQGGTVYDLTAMASDVLGPGAVLDQAHAITNNGWISGTGTDGSVRQFFRMRIGGQPDFVVTHEHDDPDADLSDGVCDSDLSTPGTQCTLRAALEEANAVEASESAPRITFALPPGAEMVPESPLPVLSRAMDLDGTSQPGGPPVLNGLLLTGTTSALRIVASGVRVRGLAVGGAAAFGIDVEGAAEVSLTANHIGILPDGTPLTNGAGALRIMGSTANATVGSRGPEADANTLLGSLVVQDGARARVLLNTLEVEAADATGIALRSPLDVDADGPTCGAWARTASSTPAPPRVLELASGRVRGLSTPGDTVVVYRVVELGEGNGRYWARRVEPLALGAADASGAFEIPVQLQAGDRVALTALSPEGYSSELSQVRRPVIFAPGIGGTWLRDTGGDDLWIPVVLGSEEKNARVRRLAMEADGSTSVEPLVSNEVLESVLGARKVYGPIHDHLEAAGYPGHPFNEGAPALDQWRFPNDWRRSAAVLAEDLRALVDRVTTNSGRNTSSAARSCQVDLVAHSNGGVIASVYVLRDAEHARDHLHRYVTSGTPYLGADQAYAAHTNGYIFGVDEELSYFFGWDVAWGDMIAMTRNVPGAYGLLPSEAYFEAINPATPSYAHGYGLVDLHNEPLDGYEATIHFLTRAKTLEGIVPSGMARNGQIRSDQASSVQGLVGNWRTYEGPPHIFRHVGQLVGQTEVGWFMGPGPEFLSDRETARSEAGDTNRHRAYRERLVPVLGLGDETVPLLSATLGRSPLVGDTDFSGVDESPWIEEFEAYACSHGDLVEEGCRPVGGNGPDAMDRIVQILAEGSVVPGSDEAAHRTAQAPSASSTAEVIYALATAPVTVAVTDASGRVTGPPDPARPNAVVFDAPGVAYRSSRFGASVGLRSDQAYTLTVRSADPDARVTLVRQQHGVQEVSQILYPDQPLPSGGVLTFELAAGGTETAAPWMRDANGDGTPEDVVAPVAVLAGTAAVPAIPWPQPEAIARPAADQYDVQTVALRLPATGTEGWTFALAEDAPWLSMSAASGAVPAEVTLTLDPDGLPSGNATTEVTLTLTNGAYTHERTVPVTLRVGVNVADENAPETPDALAVVVAPNPARGRAGVVIALPSPARAQLTVHDALGRVVARLHDAYRLPGTYELPLDVSSWAPGAYIIRLVAGGERTTQRLTIVR